MDERLKSWIVKILPSEDAEVAQGTGFWAAEGGYVLTCTHVVEGMSPPWVEYRDQKTLAEIVAQEGDVTLLKVQGLSGEPTPLGTEWQREDKIDSLGYQYEGVDPRIGYFPIEGTIAGSSELDGTERITLKEAIHVKPGTSGAPALNRRTGKVIGIISDKWEQHQVAFVLPLSEVLKQWDVLKKAVEKIEVEPLRNAICQFLETIKNEFKYVPIFHPPHKIVLQDHYIPIEVTLERRYRHAVETSWGYAEGEAEFARAYAMKGFDEMREETRRVQVPWQEARQKHKRLIVLADPGMGKTVLLKMEAVLGAQASCLHNSPPFDRLRTSPGRGKGWVSEVIVPLFFRLSEFADTNEEIAETIPRLLQRNHPNIAPTILSLITEKLKNGTCLLLLDALDEVPQEQRNPLAEKLNRFAHNYPSSPIIVTSRIVGYGGGILHDAKEVEIVPFTHKQIDQYIETWFRNAKALFSPQKQSFCTPEGLIYELQQKPQIRGLAQNPLLLSLLCSLYQEGELTLPAQRVQIYEQAVHYMLFDWRHVSERRVTEQALTDAAWIEAKLDLLEHLAYQFSCEYKEMFSMRELLTKIEECKGSTALKHHNAPDIIKELSQEDGIIQQLDGQGRNARYIFLHRTFQEYLTAAYLKRQPNGIKLAKAHFWDFDWHETLILFAGLADDPRLFLNTLLAERDDIFHMLLLLAGRCLAECSQIEIPRLIDQLYNVWRLVSYYEREFVESTIVLVGQTHQRMLTQLLVALHDTHGSIRGCAALALGQIGDGRAVEGLLVASHDPDLFVRDRAVAALGQIGDARAVESLLAASHDADEDVRDRAAAVLEQIVDAQAVEGLLVTLHDGDKGARRWAAEMLGGIGGVRAVDGLLAALHDTHGYVRRQAAIALGGIGDARAVEGLLAALHDTHGYVRGRAAEALGEIGDARAVEGLLAALHDTHGYVRGRAAEALGEIGDARAVDGLLAALHNANRDVRGRVAVILGEIGEARVVDGLLTALHNTNRDVRGRAAVILGEIGDAVAVDGLLAALHDHWEVRREAAAALGKIGDARAVDGLLAALHNADGDVRGRAAETLGQIGTLDVLETLLHRLDIDIYDKDIFPVVRRLAITFSQQHPRPTCLPVYPQPLFLRLLKKGFWWGRIFLNVLNALIDAIKRRDRDDLA